jgi:hypothetical protein
MRNLPGELVVLVMSILTLASGERLTFFNDFPGFKASNPVVSDDGRFIAFQMARVGDPAGVGRGIFVYDVAKAAATAKR